jgi:glycosyltransferase involved in cell wall biosynthesis
MRQESGLVVDVDQDGALAGAMARLADEPELTTRFRERALRNAQDASWERILHGFWEGRAGTDAGSTRRAELYRIQTRWSAIPATGADAAA